MSNEPNMEGAKTLLRLSANDEFAKLEITEPKKAFNLLYENLCAQMTQASVCIVMAVERLRMEYPDIYQQYITQIQQALMRANADLYQN